MRKGQMTLLCAAQLNFASAIKLAHAFGCDLRVLSAANEFFILKHHGLMDCLSEINTNPCIIDEQGRLRILPYHDFHSSSYGCTICPPSMCKGLILEKIQASVATDGKKHKQLIYVGDGAPDFCAGLKLDEGDFLMARRDFPI
ncbi:inorganic pyrophosphatase 2 [Prunus yedoensis var. nudiflora]|uniref:Inorganic pyrophosphatase 2 n=1 Tax=Prunus yedoensis var. nudiflora TaxID=2094558 RepID=A0A314XGT2_PRUYE|nr:inorganic pyrophosphatase 2 [Prunus yedoensis var. nudiflora]